MSNFPKHLLFYDGTCGLCDHAVNFVLFADRKKRFVFAPLQGQTAKIFLQSLPFESRGEDSMILIENYYSQSPKTYLLGKAALRSLWLIGGIFKLLGLLYFILPAKIIDPFYRFIAKRRYKIFGKKECVVFPEKYKGRFLP